MSAHLRLISTTADPARGDGDDWTVIEEGAGLGQEMVRAAEAAGLCVSCWQTNGNDPRHCWGNDCRNQTTHTDQKETP
ncbi:hypothetical protein [Streptomyces graminilatus]|uniref:hypothetical protein n=1 Tax=Streptomyces graminilatus TaxID=1464070 RepID=UPI0006E2FD15|nr:hypothetical protein [Streptomyces graminilatus]